MKCFGKYLVVSFLLPYILWSSVVADDLGYWFIRADLPTARQEILPAALDGKIYIAGGYSAAQTVSDLVEVFDPTTNTWSTVAPLPQPHHHCALAAAGGKLYAIAGYLNPGLPWVATDSVHAYDPVSDEWTPCASLAVSRGEHCAITFEGKIYVIGGNNAYGDDIFTVEVYDPALDSWSVVSPMPTERHHPGVAVIDSLIYVAGGRQGYWGMQLTVVGVLEAYSPASDTWYSLPDMLTPRSAHSAAAYNGKLYTFGGEIPGVYDEVEEFDPATNIWRALTPMLTPRHGTNAVVIGDTIFVIGGSIFEGMGIDNSNDCFILGSCVDTDYDGYGDPGYPENTCYVDNCPAEYNPSQTDSDGDNIGDDCDPCQLDSLNDTDGDGYCADVDNCPDVYNPDQEDNCSDGVGDSCCCVGERGNIQLCGSCDYGDQTVDISDLTDLIDHLFIGYAPICCPEEADIAPMISGGVPDETVDISDLTALIDHMFINYPPLPGCE